MVDKRGMGVAGPVGFAVPGSSGTFLICPNGLLTDAAGEILPLFMIPAETPQLKRSLREGLSRSVELSCLPQRLVPRLGDGYSVVR